MKKLTSDEEHALAVLKKHGSYCPSWDELSDDHLLFLEIMGSLAKKKRATVEMTDDGPRYHAEE